MNSKIKIKVESLHLYTSNKALSSVILVNPAGRVTVMRTRFGMERKRCQIGIMWKSHANH